MTISSVDKKRENWPTLNGKSSFVSEATTSGKATLKWPFCFHLLQLLPALPSLSLPSALGLNQRLMSPDSHPKQSCQWVRPLRVSLRLSPFYTPGLYSVNWNNKKDICEWSEDTRDLGGCCKCPRQPSPQRDAGRHWGQLLPDPPLPRHSTVIHSNPLSSFRNYRDFFFKEFLWRKSNPRRASFRIKRVN